MMRKMLQEVGVQVYICIQHIYIYIYIVCIYIVKYTVYIHVYVSKLP